MKLTQISIDDCHKHLLEIANCFDQICRKHQIPYYMLGGTMLGAIRHKGFIPWDDDMDFGIPRPYFEKFIKIAKQELTTTFQIQKPLIQKKFIKIEFKGSLLFEKNFDNKKNTSYTGIAIDIFPLDGANNKSFKGRLHILIAFFLIKILEGKLCSLNIRNGYKKIIAYLIKLVPINEKKLSSFIDNWIQKNDYENSNLIANFYGNWKEKEIIEKSIFSTPTLYKFNDYQFYGVTYYDQYLKMLYGDYMKLPSKEKQTSHADKIYIYE